MSMDMRPQIMALIRAGWSDTDIVDALYVDVSLVRWVRRWMCSGDR